MKTSNIARISLSFAGILLFGVAPIRGDVTVSLPQTTIRNASNFTVGITTSELEAEDHVNSFYAKFTFDSGKVSIATNAATNAGLTADSCQWSVYGALLPGSGPIRTYVISIYSTSADDKGFEGWGTLCNLNVTRVTNTAGSTDLSWLEDSEFSFWDFEYNAYSTTFIDGGIIVAPTEDNCNI